MKCKAKVGDLVAAIQMARFTLDKVMGSDFAALYLAAKKGRGGNNRIVIHSCDTTSRTLLRVDADVEEIGTLIVDPIRLTSVLEQRHPDEVVTFASEPAGSRVIVRVGGGRVTLSSAASKAAAFESMMNLFPLTAPDRFKIEAANLKALLDRTAEFTYRHDGRDNLKAVRIRPVAGGYEAMATNVEVCARALVEDANSTGESAKVIEIPNHALDSLQRMLNRNKNETIRVITVGNDATPNQVYFRTEDVFYGTSLSATSMPTGVDAIFDLKSVESRVAVPRTAMLATVQRSNPYCSTSRSGRLVALTLADGTLKLSAKDDLGEFEEIIPVESYEGTLNATFPVSYFGNILRKSSEDSVAVQFGRIASYNRPVAFIQEGGSHGASYVVGAAG